MKKTLCRILLTKCNEHLFKLVLILLANLSIALVFTMFLLTICILIGILCLPIFPDSIISVLEYYEILLLQLSVGGMIVGSVLLTIMFSRYLCRSIVSYMRSIVANKEIRN